MRNPSIQLVSCTLRPDSSMRSISLQQLFFPDDWIEPLNTLQSERSNRPEKHTTVLIKSLNAVLQAFLPDLLAAPNALKRADRSYGNEESENGRNGASPWLLTRSALPPGTLWRIIQIWLQETYGECESFSELESVLREEDLQWQSHTLELFQKLCENGTADIPSLAYKVIPSLLADLLVEREAKLMVGKSLYYLAKVVTDEGAELMTWPPVYVETTSQKEKEKKKFGYSYTIKITLQTIPGHEEPRIHFHYGVRRWRCESCYDGTTLYLKRRTNVYLRPQKKWYEQSPGKNKTFLQAKIEAVKNGEQGERIPIWMNLVPKIAARIDVPLPDAHIIAKQPLVWLEGVHGLEAGMIYSTQGKLPIGLGIGPDVCEDITKRLLETLSDHLTLQPLCQPYIIPRKGEHHPLMDDLREIPKDIRLEALEQSVGSDITIEIRWTTEAVRDMLFDRVLAMLTGTRPELVLPEKKQDTDNLNYHDFDEDTEDDIDLEEEEGEDNEKTDVDILPEEQSQSKKPRKKRAEEPDPAVDPPEKKLPLPGGGQVRIVTLPLQDINGPLPAKEKNQSRSALFQERAALITQLIPPAQEPTLTFIELPNYRERQLRQRFGVQGDPKPAIRLGMAHTGRLTQFITSESKGLRERCASSVRDGLRQLGYLPYPIDFSMRKMPIPDPLLVLGVWFIRITKRRATVGVHLPVIVLLHTARHQIMAWLPHDGRIRPYYQALLEITHLNPEQVKKRKREEALNQVRQFLLGSATRQGVDDVVVFTMAQNARSTWQGLYNTEVPFDALRFERGQAPFSPQVLPVRYRLVRVRTNLRGETPEWYVPGSQPSTTAQGIWVEDGADAKKNRLFYNIANKPHTAPKKYIGKQDKPRENYRLSSVVEVMPLILHDQDQPVSWAVMVDQWRRMGYLTSDMTLLPLPLEFARKMGEYAEVIGPWVFPDEWDEEENEEEETEEEEEGGNEGKSGEEDV
jgi:hypothetical protein